MPVSPEDTTKTFLAAWLKVPFLWDVNQYHWVINSPPRPYTSKKKSGMEPWIWRQYIPSNLLQPISQWRGVIFPRSPHRKESSHLHNVTTQTIIVWKCYRFSFMNILHNK